jgi:hypothetical protein
MKIHPFVINNSLLKSKISQNKHSVLSVSIVRHHLGPILEPEYGIDFVGKFMSYKSPVSNEVSHMNALGTLRL